MALKLLALAAGLVLAAFGFAAAQQLPDAERLLINKLMREQQLIAVNNVTSPDSFVPDNDPNTMQIVFFTGPGKSRVSDDGEVVYISVDANLNYDEQSAMTYEAARRKAERILAAQAPKP